MEKIPQDPCRKISFEMSRGGNIEGQVCHRQRRLAAFEIFASRVLDANIHAVSHVQESNSTWH